MKKAPNSQKSTVEIEKVNKDLGTSTRMSCLRFSDEIEILHFSERGMGQNVGRIMFRL